MPNLTTILPDETGIRLDRWFRRHYPALAHGRLEKMLRTGQIRLDGRRVKASARLEAGQNVRVPPGLGKPGEAAAPADNPSARKQVRQWLLYEDDDVLILNKPPGLAVQGGTGQRRHLDALLDGWRDDRGGRPKLAHRLDRDTSGVLVLAKSAFAASKLAASFRAQETRKIYWAVTIGAPRPARGRIDLALKKIGMSMVGAADNDPEAKAAATLYAVLEPAGKQAALVALSPLTGRTHQLRAHLLAAGAPILGDPLYKLPPPTDGSAATNWPAGEIYQGLHLHARRLMIPHPRGGMIDAVAPVPPALQKSFDWFGFSRDHADPFEGAADAVQTRRKKKP